MILRIKQDGTAQVRARAFPRKFPYQERVSRMTSGWNDESFKLPAVFDHPVIASKIGSFRGRNPVIGSGRHRAMNGHG
jgi:hypothetical protein